MKYAYFPGCKIAHHLPEYGQSVAAVCARLGIGLLTQEFACCGYPVRHESLDASFFTALRNLALAQQTGLDVLTPCKCCYGNFRHAVHRSQTDAQLKERLTAQLHAEGLPFPDSVNVRHFLQILDAEIGAPQLTSLVTRALTGLNIACHYGCHALRPEAITHFDDPLAPTIFERLVQATGAQTVNWELRLECCGYPLRGRDERIADLLMAKKLASAKQAGATVLATACTYCQLQFRRANDDGIRPVLFSQLLGLALGLKPDSLDLPANIVRILAPFYEIK